MSGIEERMIQAIAEVIEEHTYGDRYGGGDRCSCCHQYVRYAGMDNLTAHEDSCPIPLLHELRTKLMEGNLPPTENVV